jgi:hypothetical protein
MEEKVCYLTIKVCYRTDGTHDNPATMIGENCDYNVDMPGGYGIEISETELVDVIQK